jgi:hypothetical protein
VVSIMSNANLKTAVKINRNACFIIKQNLFLINQNNKLNVNMEQDVSKPDVPLNIHKNNKIK